MDAEKRELYGKLEAARESKVIAYATGDRRGLETQIGSDVYDLLVDHLTQLSRLRGKMHENKKSFVVFVQSALIFL